MLNSLNVKKYKISYHLLEFLKNEPGIEDWIDNPPELTSHLFEIHYNFYQVLAGVTHRMFFYNFMVFYLSFSLLIGKFQSSFFIDLSSH